jgi:deazaflavin-dependent oxidoreductase (nitroreductase family)
MRALMRAPLWLYRLGWGEALRFTPLLALTTRGRNTGQSRHAIVEYRRHGRKLYVISAWGKQADWVQNALAHPVVTVQLGARPQRYIATRLSDPAEAVRALYLFRKSPFLYEVLLTQMSQKAQLDLMTLKLVAHNFTILRLEPDPANTEPENEGIVPDLQGISALMGVVGVLTVLWLLWRVVRRGL